MMTHTELGKAGEAYVGRLLSSAGLQIRFDGPADLTVNGLPVEVKAARPTLYRSGGYVGYQFCLNRPGHTRVKAPVVILLCYWDPTNEPIAFVIPADHLGQRRKVVIPVRYPWLYSGKWSRWYQRWETIADLLERWSTTAVRGNGRRYA